MKKEMPLSLKGDYTGILPTKTWYEAMQLWWEFIAQVPQN